MPKRSSRDINQIAARIIEETTGINLEGKNPAAVALGRMGGLKGGNARAQRLTADERTAIAKNAAVKRWERERKKKKVD